MSHILLKKHEFLMNLEKTKDELYKTTPLLTIIANKKLKPTSLA